MPKLHKKIYARHTGKKRNLEEAEQRELFNQLSYWGNKYPDIAEILRWVYHCPNAKYVCQASMLTKLGGEAVAKANAAAGYRVKLLGVKPGVWDLHLPMDNGEYRGLFIEMKYGVNKLSPDQIEFQDFVNKWGPKTKMIVCKSWESALREILFYINNKLNFLSDIDFTFLTNLERRNDYAMRRKRRKEKET